MRIELPRPKYVWFREPMIAVGRKLGLKPSCGYIVLPDVTSFTIKKEKDRIELQFEYRGGNLTVYANKAMLNRITRHQILSKDNSILVNRCLSDRECNYYHENYNLIPIYEKHDI